MITIWKLAKGADRRIRTGHPWVFSNELSHSPKGLTPGALVRLQDVQGNFVAWGYGNPHSLIAFRVLSFNESDNLQNPQPFLLQKVLSAWVYRKRLQKQGSFRMCYSEADGLPGLVIDYYLLEVSQGKASQEKRAQVLSLQITTAGIQYLIGDEKVFCEKLVQEAKLLGLTDLSWSETFVVLHNDVGIRKLEGLEVLPAQLAHAAFDLQEGYKILVEAASGKNLVPFSVDLIDGQKTGFFLDQWKNIQELVHIALSVYGEKKPDEQSRKIRVLDLCTYVGQWSTQLAHAFQQAGIECEFTLVDISENALKFARQNVSQFCSRVIIEQKDVVNELDYFANDSYDIVIADPPAFIKAKKDIPQGKHAYLKINTHAFRCVKKDGLVVSCSCSGLLEETDFFEMLGKAIRRSGKTMRVAAQARHSVDHPLVLQFPEGHYLKMLLHVGQ